MLIYQIIILFNDDFYLKDIMLTDKFIILSIVAIILVFLLQLRNKLAFYSSALDLKQQIENEINKIETE